jgi:hypothetical protein
MFWLRSIQVGYALGIRGACCFAVGHGRSSCIPNVNSHSHQAKENGTVVSKNNKFYCLTVPFSLARCVYVRILVQETLNRSNSAPNHSQLASEIMNNLLISYV